MNTVKIGDWIEYSVGPLKYVYKIKDIGEGYMERQYLNGVCHKVYGDWGNTFYDVKVLCNEEITNYLLSL